METLMGYLWNAVVFVIALHLGLLIVYLAARSASTGYFAAKLGFHAAYMKRYMEQSKGEEHDANQQ
jgi:hypothetical protein